MDDARLTVDCLFMFIVIDFNFLREFGYLLLEVEGTWSGQVGEVPAFAHQLDKLSQQLQTNNKETARAKTE